MSHEVSPPDPARNLEPPTIPRRRDRRARPRGRRVGATLPVPLARALERLAREVGVPVDDVVRAAIGLVLGLPPAATRAGSLRAAEDALRALQHATAAATQKWAQAPVYQGLPVSIGRLADEARAVEAVRTARELLRDLARRHPPTDEARPVAGAPDPDPHGSRPADDDADAGWWPRAPS